MLSGGTCGSYFSHIDALATYNFPLYQRQNKRIKDLTRSGHILTRGSLEPVEGLRREETKP